MPRMLHCLQAVTEKGQVVPEMYLVGERSGWYYRELGAISHGRGSNQGWARGARGRGRLGRGRGDVGRVCLRYPTTVTL